MREYYAGTTGVIAIDGDQPKDRVAERSAANSSRPTPKARAVRGVVTLKSAREIERIRASGRVVAEVLEALEAEIRPGVATVDLDRLAESIISRHEGRGRRSRDTAASRPRSAPA